MPGAGLCATTTAAYCSELGRGAGVGGQPKLCCNLAISLRKRAFPSGLFSFVVVFRCRRRCAFLYGEGVVGSFEASDLKTLASLKKLIEAKTHAWVVTAALDSQRIAASYSYSAAIASRCETHSRASKFIARDPSASASAAETDGCLWSPGVQLQEHCTS